MIDPLKISESNPVLLYDSYCGLCTKSVQFILKRKKYRHFRFLAIEDALQKLNLKVETDSLTLIHHGRQLTRSSAIFQICKSLGMPWSILAIFQIIPKPVRDSIYDYIAKNRYRWFGKKDACYLPPEDVSDLFLKP